MNLFVLQILCLWLKVCSYWKGMVIIMAKEKKEKVVYEPIKGVMGEATDYHVYEMTLTDRIIAALIGFGGTAVVIYVFFRSILFIFPVGAFLAIKAQPIYQEYKRKKRQKELLLQFKDLLESLTSSYSAGQNTVAAFADAEVDMTSIYGETADIVAEIKLIRSGMMNNHIIEELLTNFAQRSGLEDVESFANVFEISNRMGSDLKRVISDSREIINDKIEIEMEIETMLTSNKNDLNIMMVMPLVIVMSMSSLGTSTIASNTPLNLVIKIGCIIMFGIAYAAGMKIVDIKV